MEDVAVKPKEQEVIDKKRASWATMGQKVHEAEMQLQAMAQAAIKDLKLPANISEVADAEAKLKELKSNRVKIVESRKQITSVLDNVSERLMAPEKSLADPEKKLTDAIIAVKKEDERIRQIKIWKEQEVKNIEQSIKTFLANKDYDFRTDIQNKISVAYEHALKTDVKPSEVEGYIKRCVEKVGVMNFQIDKPSFTLKHVLPEELDQLLQQHFLFNPHAYVNILQKQMEEKFSDYDVAYENKQVALQLAKQEEEANKKALKEKLENEKIAAALHSSATQVIEDSEVRALKKSYVVDMPETVENALLIMRAFSGNLHLCLAKLKINKWFSVTPAQMATALGKIKCDDNNFQPAGINFKEVDKL